ncbi:MAG: TonB-dependent receptor [Azoarcus sp.]|nr:TonB-dependent receptor [Azoarcus sp.]
MRTTRRLTLAIVASVWCQSSPAGAPLAENLDLADLSLDDLLRVEVVGAARYAQPLADSPTSITVIAREELREQGYRNIAEALTTVPGVYASNDRNYTYLGVRGFNRSGDYNSRILLLTDGARRNDAIYDQAQVGNEGPVEIDWIKRLEFVSGPVSAVYGGNALFGIVNAVMLDGGDVNGARVTVDAGSGQSRRLGIVAGQRLDGDGDWFFGFAAYGAEGKDHYYPEFDNGVTDGSARGLDGERYRKAYAKFRWGDWRLIGGFAARDKDLPNAPFATAFGESGTRTLDQNTLLELAYDGSLGDDLQQQFRVFNGSYRYDGAYHYSGPLDNRDDARADWSGIDYRLSGAAGPSHRWMLGAERQWNTRLLQRNHDVAPRTEILDTDDPSRTLGLFVQDEWRFHPQWLLNLSLRHDRHSDYSPINSPRIALIFQPHADMTLKAMFHRAYRPPNAYERFYDDGGLLQKANPELRPERTRSVELTADFRLGRAGRAGISLYRNEMRDMIEQVTDPGDGLEVFTNVSRVRAHGVEMDAEHHWAGGYRVRGSIGWQQSRMADGNTLVNSPRLLGKLVFAVPLPGGWKAAGQWQGMSERKTLNGRVAGHGVVNLVLSTGAQAGIGEWRVGIYNLGDRRYSDPASSAFMQDAIEQDRRQFRLSWTIGL